MSSRAPTPADGSPAPSHGLHGDPHEGLEGAASLASPALPSPAARAAAFARALAGALRKVVRHPFWRGLGRALVRVAIGLAALALVIGLLVRFVLWPQASAAREWLQERGSAEVSADVTIGGLDTYWDGWHPAFRARDVRAIDKDKRLLFSAASIDGMLGWRSLFSLDLQFVSFTAAQADLLVRRTPEGKLLVAGMPVDPASNRTDDDRFLHWLLNQGRIDLTGGKLRWLDEKNRLPQLDVADIQLQASRDGNRHTITLTADSGALAPQPIVFQANFRHDYLRDAGNWHHWTGSASWNLTRVQLPVVQRYHPIFEKVASGTFSTDGTIEFGAGRIARSQSRLRGSQIDLQLAGAQEPLRLANAQALLLHSSDRDGNHQLTIDTLLWQPQPAEGPPAAAAPHAPEGTWREGMRKVTMGWALDGKRQLRKFSLKAPTFDLNTVRALATSMPIDTAVLRQLRALQPAGHIDNLDVNWSRDRAGLLDHSGGKTHYTVQGTLRDASVNAQPANPPLRPNGKPELGVPGFTHLSGSFSFNDQKGSARFEGNGASMTFPGMFEEPRVPFDEIAGEVSWKHEKDKLVVTIPGVRFANADTAGNVSGSWRQGGDNASGLADLSGVLTRAQVARIPRYLPLGIGPGTRHYLAGALAAGDATDVTFLVKGDLAHFPFHAPYEKAGDFRIEVPVRGVSYQIAPHAQTASGGPAWPLFTDIGGQVLFERGGMSFVAKHATVQGIPGIALQDVTGRIDDLSDHGKLVLDGNADGSVQGFLRYIAASPVRGWTGQVTDESRAQGNGELKLKLDMPLSHANAARVDGRFRLPGNDVMLMPQLPLLGGASGVVAFDERGFTLENMRARFVGGEARIGGGTQPDGTTNITVRGTATAAGLRDALPGTALARLGTRLEGSTAYNATIGVRERQLHIQAGSDLSGMALGLPAPLTKTAAQDMPLRFELRPATGRAGSEEMLVQLGNVLNARYVLRRGAQGLEVQAGGIGLLQPAPQPANGVAAALATDRFDLDVWRATLADLGAGQSADGTPSPFVPDRLTAKARVLHAFDRDLDDVSLDATRESAGWNIQLDSRQIAGAAQWHKDASTPSGALKLRLSRLTIPDASDAGNVADALASNIDELPAIDLVASQFTLRGRDFGKLEMLAHTSRADGEPVWTLEKLTIDQPGATLTGSGTWRVPRRLRDNAGADRRTLLNFQLAIRDAGAVLDRMGLPHTLRDGNGTLEGRVAWRGSPLSIDYPSLSGRLSLKLENGQILSVDPGAARLLGVLSLQGLMRIATLDFRSLSGEGMVFDHVAGAGTISNGVGTIEDFSLKSGQLLASMRGTADLLRETQDLHVDVVPRINATTTSVAAAFINPVLGIGTLAAQLLFADEFSKVFTQHYRISGDWANPHVAKVEENRQAPIQDRRESAFPR